jgi:hypothetical protein
MKSCPIIPIIGRVTALDPNTLDEGGVLYRYVAFHAARRPGRKLNGAETL